MRDLSELKRWLSGCIECKLPKRLFFILILENVFTFSGSSLGGQIKAITEVNSLFAPNAVYKHSHHINLLSSFSEQNIEFLLSLDKYSTRHYVFRQWVSNYNILLMRKLNIHGKRNTAFTWRQFNITLKYGSHEHIVYFDTIIERSNLDILEILPQYLYSNKPVTYLIFLAKFGLHQFYISGAFGATVIVILDTSTGTIQTVSLLCVHKPTLSKYGVQSVHVVMTARIYSLTDIRSVWSHQNFKRLNKNVITNQHSCPVKGTIRMQECILAFFTRQYNCSLENKAKYILQIGISSTITWRKQQNPWFFPTYSSFGITVHGYRHVVFIEREYRYNTGMSSFLKPFHQLVWCSIVLSIITYWLISPIPTIASAPPRP